MEKTTAPPAEALTENTAGSATYQVAETRHDSEGKITEIVLKLEDGRMVPATLADKLSLDKHDVLKTSSVTVKHDGISDGVPSKPVVTKVDR